MASVGKRQFEEFIVDTNQVSQITQAKSKIERMHEVKITLKEVVKHESKQWIKVEGDVGDRMNAREYIIAMCQPGETYQQPFDDNNREFLNEENLEEIEKQTNACIELGDRNIILIKGSELAVTLAISSLENIIGNTCIETDGASECPQSTAKGVQPSDWEKRLDTTFIRALSSNSDGTCKFDDYHNSSAEVKMTILKCLNNEYSDNVDENELFEGSQKPDPGSSSLHPIHIFGDEGEELIAGKTNESRQSNDKMSEQASDSNTTKRETKKTEETEDVKFLRTFGTSAGYSDELIDSGLMYVDDKTAPCDFLDILKQLKEQTNKNDDRTETPMDVDEPQPSGSSSSFFKDFPPPPIVDSDLEKSRRSLPKEYKQILGKHMIAEEKGEMTVLDLKKQNEERQKILKEQFESSSPQSSPRGESGSGSGRKKKKNRKKKSNKLGQNNNIVEVDSRDGDDEEETCVLKTVQDSSDEDCVITGTEESKIPVVAVVKPSSPRQSGPYRQPYIPSDNLPNQRQPYFPPDTAITQRQSNCYSDNMNPFNRNISTQNQSVPDGPRELRYIVIDGSNVAMQHGRGKMFSCKGIQICVDYFLNRGHTKVTCFVPAWRRYKPRVQNPISNQEILIELNERGILEFTPARRLENKLISSYDDRYVVELCQTVDGVIVSNDQYRDLMGEKYSWKKIIEERLLQYNFVGDIFMIPEDPLGQHGPKLDVFLSKPCSKQPSPLRKRHQPPQKQPNVWNRPSDPPHEQLYPPSILGPPPSQNHPSILGPGPILGNNWQAASSSNNIQLPWNNQGQNVFQGQHNVRSQGQNFQGQRPSNQNRFSSSPQKKSQWQAPKLTRPPRTAEKTDELIKELKVIFPESEPKIIEVVKHHPSETDLTRLSNYLINATE